MPEKQKISYKGILPSQFVGKWTNDEGKRLKVFFVLCLEDFELKKIFMPVDEFNMLDLSKLVKKSADVVYEFEFEIDDEDRENLVSFKQIGTLDISAVKVV